jgi:hypothetical protein
MMRANSRSSIRWGVATAIVALALGAVPLTVDNDAKAITGKAALADGGGNGRLVAARSPAPAAENALTDAVKSQPISSRADEAVKIEINQDLDSADDGDWIGDDSDVASVDGSANDDDAVGEYLGGSF